MLVEPRARSEARDLAASAARMAACGVTLHPQLTPWTIYCILLDSRSEGLFMAGNYATMLYRQEIAQPMSTYLLERLGHPATTVG